MKHHGKQRKTTAMIKAKEKLNSQLTGPKQFPMDRMLAIFYNIVEDRWLFIITSAHFSDHDGMACAYCS